jgi:hypothetical protein
LALGIDTDPVVRICRGHGKPGSHVDEKIWALWPGSMKGGELAGILKDLIVEIIRNPWEDFKSFLARDVLRDLFGTMVCFGRSVIFQGFVEFAAEINSSQFSICHLAGKNEKINLFSVL